MTVRRTLRGVAGVLVFLLLWEIIGRAGLVRMEYLPPPSVVLGSLGQLLGQRSFLIDVLATVLSALLALGIATAIGVPLGLLLGTVGLIRRATGAVVEFLRPIPSVALVPLAILAIGAGPQMKVSLAVYACIWPILFNTIYAMGEVDPLQTETARSFGLSRTRSLFLVSLPNAAPFVLTGVRLAASVSLILVVSVELLSSGSGGLGQFIYVASSGDGRMDKVLAGTVLAGLLGFLLDALLRGVHSRWFGWGSDREAAR